ncbi:ABC transporter [Vibrio sp. 10N.286.49.B3]|uniref:ABC transporter permease n=1 Tax=Vibrio sp. 10N.286.49.B3 TaxID=1880855 RepID=UPI000C84AC8A|nr:ABC transporter permease [Vibrio sp. 10N.286.49.B3]PMH45936.1 ABC transporter [Vibrio sp. 10N.286.49.B3]
MGSVRKRSILAVWKDVIFAIFVRQIRSKFNDKLGVSWSVVSPLIFIMVLTLIRGSIDGGETHTLPTFFFMVYGILLIRFFMETLSVISSSINSSKPLFAFRQVQPISAVIAIALFELLSRIVVVICIFIIAYFLRVEISISNLLGVMFCFFQIWILATSIGLLLSLIICYIPEVNKVRTLLLRPLIFISGAFFSLQDIPPELWKYFTWNPILHAIEYSRHFAYSTYSIDGLDIMYLNFVTLIFFFFSLCCYHATWKHAINR